MTETGGVIRYPTGAFTRLTSITILAFPLFMLGGQSR